MYVVYLPGILGSNLSIDRGQGQDPSAVWPDPAALLNGGLADLQLGPDGKSPGPLSKAGAVVPVGLYAPIYAPLYYFMLALGWNVVAVPYDWRVSVLTSAAAVWSQIKALVGNQPIYIVAHSQGGLLALAVSNRMVQEGRGGQLVRIVTLATPMYGSMEIVKLFCQLPYLYQALVVATGWKRWVAGSPGPPYVDAVLATLGGFYELMAFRAAGPLFASAPDQAAAIYDVGFYAGGNDFLVPTSFLTAEAVQTALLGDVPAGKLVTILGTGQATAYQLAPGGSPRSAAGYLYTPAGDGIVTTAQGTLLGVPSLAFPDSHAGILLDGLVWAALASIVPNGLAG
jgi:hypothetical protein